MILSGTFTRNQYEFDIHYSPLDFFQPLRCEPSKGAISIMFRLLEKPEADLAFIRLIYFSHPLIFPRFRTVRVCRTSVTFVVVYPLSSSLMV